MSINRFNQYPSNILDDYYALALSIATIYKNSDNIFINAPSKNSKGLQKIPEDCFKFPQESNEGFLNRKELEIFCIEALKANTINALKTTFGEEENVGNSDKMNFTTLIGKIVDYNNSKITPKEIHDALEKLIDLEVDEVENFKGVVNNKDIPFQLAVKDNLNKI